MAQADGSIVFETKVDNSEAQKGLSQLEKEIQKTEREIAKLEDQKAPLEQQFERAAAAADEVRESINRMKDELTQAQAALDSKQGFDMPLEEFIRYSELVKTLPAQIAAQEAEYAKLGGEADKLNTKLQSYDDKLQQANTRLAEMQDKAGGLARELTDGMDEQAYQDVLDQAEGIVEAQEQVAESAENAAKSAGLFQRLGDALRQVAQAAGSAASNMAKVAGQGVANGVKGIFSGLAGAAKTAGHGIAAGLKGALSGLQSLGSHIASAARGFASLAQAGAAAFAKIGQSILGFVGHMNVFSKLASGLSGKLARLGTMIKQAFVFNVISQGLTALRGQISSYLSQNAAFTSALNSLQGALSTAFQPILNAAVPAMVTLMNVISSVISAIGRLLAALASIGGRSKSNAKALNTQAKAMGGAGGAADEASKSLAKFDEINRLAADSGGGGGGGGGGAGEAELPDYEFETSFNTWGEAFNAFLDTIINDGLPRLRAALLDFASWLNNLSANVYEMFTFPGVQDKVRYIGEQVADAFNDMVDYIDWDLLGRAIGAGLNTALALAVGFLYTFDWVNAGRSLAAAVNGLVDEVNWYDFGKLLWSGFKIGLETLAGFLVGLRMPEVAIALSNLVKGFFNSMRETVEKIQWNKIGSKIADLLNNFDWDGAISSVSGAIISALKGLKSLVDGFLSKWQWKSVADTISSSIRENIKKIPWEGIGETLGNFFSTTLLFLIRATAKIPWEEIGSGISTTLNQAINSVPWMELGSWLSTLFIKVLNGLKKGIQDFDWKNLGQSVSDALNGVDWKELLSSLADTLLTAIDAALDLLIGLLEGLDWYSTAKGMADGLIEAIGNHDWGGTASKLYEALGAAVRAANDAVLGIADAIIEALINGLFSSIEFFHNEIEEAGGNIIKGIFNGCKKIMLGIAEWVLTNIVDPFLEGLGLTEGGYFRQRIEEAGGDLIAGFFKGIVEALGPFGDLLKPILNTFGITWDEIYSTTDRMSKKTRDTTERQMQGVSRSAVLEMNSSKSAVEKNWDEIHRTTATKSADTRRNAVTEWKNTKRDTESLWANIADGLEKSWQNIYNTSHTSAGNVKKTTSSAWEDTRRDTNEKWEGISSDLNRDWEKIGKDADLKFSSTHQNINTEWENTQRDSSEIWDTIWNDLGKDWDDLDRTSGEKFNAISDNVKRSFQESQSTTDLKMRAITQVVGEQSAAALKGLSDNFSKAQAAITTPLTTAKNDAQNLGWYGLGSNIVDGISAGVRERAAQLANSVANAAYNALRSAKNALGIHSPSTVARDELGANFMEGFAIGVDQNQGVVDSSMEDMAEGMTDSFRDMLSPKDMLSGILEFLQSMIDGIREAVAALAELRQATEGFSMTLPMPAIASGTVIPQSREFLSVVSGQGGGAGGVSEEAIRRIVREESGGGNTELLQAILEAVRAGHIIMVDKRVLGKTVTEAQNRMTRASGRSALLT